MPKYITDLKVSLDEAEEKNLQSGGFMKIDANLNKGAGRNTIFLWYKKDSDSAPITRLQVTFRNDMVAGLRNAGYTKIDEDLNAGTGGDVLYLWYFKEQTEYDTPIVSIDISTTPEDEAKKIRSGWEKSACDLNRGNKGDWIHIWVKRENPTYICDVNATDAYGSDVEQFNRNYIRVDEDTNRGAAGGSPVFIWYRQTTDPKDAVTDLQISINKEDIQRYQDQGYTKVNANLNQGAGGNEVYLWYKKDQGAKIIKGINLLLNPATFKVFNDTGARIIEKNLNEGNHGIPMYLAVHNK